MNEHYFKDIATFEKERAAATSFSVSVLLVDDKSVASSSLIPVEHLDEFCTMLDTLDITANLYLWNKQTKELIAVPVRQIKKVVIGLI